MAEKMDRVGNGEEHGNWIKVGIVKFPVNLGFASRKGCKVLRQMKEYLGTRFPLLPPPL
jgi:hypothetical protein